MFLPDWLDVTRKKNMGEELTPLEAFIYHNEPSDDIDAQEFRQSLSELIVWLTDNVEEKE